MNHQQLQTGGFSGQTASGYTISTGLPEACFKYVSTNWITKNASATTQKITVPSTDATLNGSTITVALADASDCY
jgi:hypothetical protein